MQQQPRRVGRPLKASTPGARASLGLKVTNEVKQRLGAAAQANGRTQSQEAEARLEQSFRDERLLPQLLDGAYGPEIAALLMLFGRVMRDTSTQAGFFAHRTLAAAENPLGSAYTFDQIETAISCVLEAVRPTGDTTLPRQAGDKSWDLQLASGGATLGSVFEKIGAGFAKGALEAVANEDRGGGAGQWAESVRSRLGPDIARRIAASLQGPALSDAEDWHAGR